MTTSAAYSNLPDFKTIIFDQAESIYALEEQFFLPNSNLKLSGLSGRLNFCRILFATDRNPTNPLSG